ncbi:MAG: VOC family protein [Chthonomonas sp.]|nr:VOC family protein [Chthonomonas sp.]
MVRSLHTIVIEVDDMAAATTFYRDVLGLKTQIESPYWTSLDCFGTTLGLHPPFVPGETPRGGVVLCLAVADLVAAQAALRAVGAWCADAFHGTPSGAVLDIKDPSGNPLQLIQLGLSV